MASGNYSKRGLPDESAQAAIPLRTRQLPSENEPESQGSGRLTHIASSNMIDAFVKYPLTRMYPWLRPYLFFTICVVVAAFVLIYAGFLQRPEAPQLVISPNGQVFPIQVGGTIKAVNTWTNSTGPLDPRTPIPAHVGPYSVLSKPTLTVDFMNQVLAFYNSPAAGRAQALSDLGVKYGIDPAFALAFFMHESTFGTAGVARTTLSLGNLRCIPDYPCYQGGYAQFSSWEQGFEAWYKLIRNLYVAQWGKVTIDQIIPIYAPASDNNNELAYIHALKHALDTWHAGNIVVV